MPFAPVPQPALHSQGLPSTKQENEWQGYNNDSLLQYRDPMALTVRPLTSAPVG